MENRNNMKHLTFRLKSGQFLKEEIEARAKDIKAGVLLSIVGALENANLRMAGATADQLKLFPEPERSRKMAVISIFLYLTERGRSSVVI